METSEKFFGFRRENFITFLKMPPQDIIWGIGVIIFFLCCWIFDWLLIQFSLRKDKPYIN